MSQTLPSQTGRARTAVRFGAIAAAVGIVAATAFMTSDGGRIAQAQVSSINPLDPALDFNAFVEGDTVLTTHEMEGPLATGGDLSMLDTYNISIQNTGTFVDGADAQPSSLVVGGAIDWDQSSPTGQVPVLGQGYVKVGDLTGTDVLNTDQNGATVNTQLVPAGAEYNSLPRVGLTITQPVDSVGPTSPIDFEAAFTEFRSTSTDLAACAATAPMTDANGNSVAKGEVEPGAQINVALTEGQTNVLNVTGTDIDNMSQIQYLPQPTETSPLLINVDTTGSGGVLEWTVPTQPGASGDTAPYILWNFSDATELTLAGGDTVEGSIYAPNAAYTDLSATNVEGQIVTASANLGSLAANGGETHYFPFNAELTCEEEVDPSPSTTGPTTDEPTTDEPTTDEPTTGQVTSEIPSDGDSTSDGIINGGGLPITGTSIVAIGIVALALAGGGVALLAASRRSRGQH